MKNQYYVALILIFVSAAASGQSVAGQSTGPQSFAQEYRPITGRQRAVWFARSTVGPESLVSGLFSSGFSTALNRPKEYGTHWDGFGKRYGMRLTGVSTGNAIEATLGSLWGEDPRYFRADGQPFKGRVKNVVVMTFIARRSDGTLAPAYARYMGNAGNNFLSNTWRPDSSTGTGDTCVRILLGFAGKMTGNALAEFWPDASKYIFHRKR
jgi:hypothetical protein